MFLCFVWSVDSRGNRVPDVIPETAKSVTCTLAPADPSGSGRVPA